MNEFLEKRLEEYLNKNAIGEVPSKVIKNLVDTFVLSEDEALKLYKEWRKKFINKA